MKFLVLGANGMTGHLISLYLHERGHDVVGFARKNSQFVNTVVGDARDLALLARTITAGNFDCVINCVGLLNQYAENDREAASFLNAYLPHFLAKVTKETDTMIFQMSTDCVFSGSQGGYREDDLPDGRSFYDRSKALGELNDEKNVTFRNSIVGPDIKREGIGLINWFMQQEGSVKGFRHAIWTGQTTLQLAKTMEEAAKLRIHGLYHMVPKSSISKYELLCLFNTYLRKTPLEILPEEDFRVDKSLIRTNYADFLYQIPDYEVQVRELGEWMRTHRELYPHYEI